MENFNVRFQKLAASNGLAQSDLVGIFGQDKSTISKWLNGEIVPGAKNMRAICEYFGCELSWLKYGDIEGRVNAQVATSNASQQSHSGAGNISMFEGDGITCTGYDESHPPDGVDAEDFAELLFWRCSRPGGMRTGRGRSAPAGGHSGLSTTTAARCNQYGRGGKRR